ncbi:hypothetical protein GJ744_005026 [Endocarpon pusillum]|uniref:FAD-binding PCMH-type domain-containing protein n=1 Tax=Endocarpon pusillum TaxID=364733 RepID=A0A8H7DZT1_9EURO|nr:hypothetical protein GJ744_005026 [Endocarpon pusillum]
MNYHYNVSGTCLWSSGPSHPSCYRIMKAPVVGALSLSALAISTARCSTCCSALAALPELQGKVYAPDTTNYNLRLKTYYSANAALAPWCMVLPESTEDVSSVARTIFQEECPFGIRSGAHSAFKGANGIKEGITIDFGYMNTTTYSQETKIASIQPGSRWGQVYETLDEYGVAAVGARADVVGVGGFTTGGGYSFYSNSRGFACDMVANFEVVLANGRVVNANEHDNSDLWKSLKGGSGNFGFVTRIDQYTVESNQLWGGGIAFDLSQRDAVFDAYLKFADNMDSDPASQLIVTIGYDGAQRSLGALLSNVDAVDMAPAFDDFYSIDNTSSTLRIEHIAKLVPEFTGGTPLGLYAHWMTGLTSNDKRIMEFIDEKHAEYVEKMKAAAPGSNFAVLILLQPVTQSMVKHSAESGGNVLGLEEIVAKGPTIMWLIVVTVDTAENQEKIHPLTIEFRDAVNKYANSIGANKNWAYLNYALGDQDPIAGYGAEVVQFLKATSHKYDPKGVFQKLRGSGFKLPA